MDNSIIMVKSASDFTIVVNIPDIPLHRTWKKRGAQYPIDKKVLFQAYYDPSVEQLFREGKLVVEDKEFLYEVGLLNDEGEPVVVPLTETMMNRLIKLMPLVEVKKELPKYTPSQLAELADYAIEHYTDLQMDRVDLLSKASGKNLMKAIEHYRQSKEA